MPRTRLAVPEEESLVSCKNSWSTIELELAYWLPSQVANAPRRDNTAYGQADMCSVHNELNAGDLAVFQKGRAMRDVLRDVQWRGALVGACEDAGRSVFAIHYELLREGDAAGYGIVCDAIFVDERFTRFVRTEDPIELGIAVRDPAGVRFSIPKRRRLDDCRWLVRHANKEQIGIDDILKQPSAVVEEHQHWNMEFETLRACEKRNVQLRDQFNAARLSIGMRPADVRATFRATPLDSGTSDSGAYEIYGSNEFLNIREPPLNGYSNVLVLYRDGKASVILPVLVGHGLDYEWRESLGEWFTDLPPAT